MAEVKIGLVDSGCSTRGSLAAGVVAEAAFVLHGDHLWRTEAGDDQTGHGRAVAGIIHGLAPAAALVSAQVFASGAQGQSQATSALQVAAAIDWLVDEGVRVINLSLGLRSDRRVLARACERAQAWGVLLVASSPARGAAVYPAAYHGVLRASGDARCAPEQWSWLASAQADVGACVQAPQALAGAGASMGCAHVTGHIAAFLSRSPAAGNEDIRRYLLTSARWLHTECKYHQLSEPKAQEVSL